MVFKIETMSEEDRKFLHENDVIRMLSGDYPFVSWLVDKENNEFLLSLGGGHPERDALRMFIFFCQYRLMHLSLKHEFKGDELYWHFNALNIPKDLDREAAITSLKGAFEAYGFLGSRKGISKVHLIIARIAI